MLPAATHRPANPCRSRRCPAITGHPSGYCEAHQPEIDRRRGSAAKRGYGRQWAALSKQVLKEEPLCRRCRLADSVLTDHIVPKRLGGTDDRSNLQALCKACHDQKNAHEDGSFVGAPTSRVVLVAGPPGAGKADFIARMFKAGDLIVDVDRLYVALSGLPQGEKPGALLPFVIEARDAVLRRLARPSAVSRSWVMAGAPTPAERERYERTLNAQVIVLETPANECLRRIASDPKRGSNGHVLTHVVGDWWATYRRRPKGDTVIPWQAGSVT